MGKSDADRMERRRPFITKISYESGLHAREQSDIKRLVAWEARVMTLVFDILHLAVAALLAIIGVGYEREEECAPVRFQPAAYTYYATDARQIDDAVVVQASDCESGRSAVQFPAL